MTAAVAWQQRQESVGAENEFGGVASMGEGGDDGEAMPVDDQAQILRHTLIVPVVLVPESLDYLHQRERVPRWSSCNGGTTTAAAPVLQGYSPTSGGGG